jgi:hypothetical protein
MVSRRLFVRLSKQVREDLHSRDTRRNRVGPDNLGHDFVWQISTLSIRCIRYTDNPSNGRLTRVHHTQYVSQNTSGKTSRITIQNGQHERGPPEKETYTRFQCSNAWLLCHVSSGLCLSVRTGDLSAAPSRRTKERSTSRVGREERMCLRRGDPRWSAVRSWRKVSGGPEEVPQKNTWKTKMVCSDTGAGAVEAGTSALLR